LIDCLARRRAGEHVDRTDLAAAMSEARAKIDAQTDRIFQEKISPLVFFVGSTGLLPDEIQAKAQTAEQLSAKFPDLDFSGDERQGLFFEVEDMILSVYAKNECFSR